MSNKKTNFQKKSGSLKTLSLNEMQKQIENRCISDTSEIQDILKDVLNTSAAAISASIGNWSGAMFKHFQDGLGTKIPLSDITFSDVVVLNQWCSANIEPYAFASAFCRELLILGRINSAFTLLLNISVTAFIDTVKPTNEFCFRLRYLYGRVTGKLFDDAVTVGDVLKAARNGLSKRWFIGDNIKRYQANMLICGELAQLMVFLYCRNISINARVRERDYPFKALSDCLWKEKLNSVTQNRKTSGKNPAKVKQQ